MVGPSFAQVIHLCFPGYMKTCGICGKPKHLKHFVQYHRGGVKKYRNYCKACHRGQEQARSPAGDEVARAEWRERYRRNVSIPRREGRDVARWVLADSRKSDRRHGRDNDLTKGFVEGLVSKGCSYCGATEIRMTLDRIDNAQGHTRENVAPACLRCNFIRGSMPYMAWLCLVEGVEKARKQGLFGSWGLDPLKRSGGGTVDAVGSNPAVLET